MHHVATGGQRVDDAAVQPVLPFATSIQKKIEATGTSGKSSTLDGGYSSTSRQWTILIYSSVYVVE